MQYDIIDNRKEKLSDHIGVLLDNAQKAKFAVGFFFLSGLQPFLDKVEDLDELRLLIDSRTNKRTMEALTLSYQNKEAVEKVRERGQFQTEKQKQKVASKTKEDLEDIMPKYIKQTDENEKYLKKLAELVKDNKFKVKIYTKDTLHAKAYIFDYDKKEGRYEEGNAIVGSSNLSLSAFESNTELNVVVPGKGNHQTLSKWFDELWEEAVDFDKELIDVIKGSWVGAKPTPYEVYLKVIYEIVEKIRRKEERGLAERPFENMPELYRYQKDAVIHGLTILDEYNGVFISDVPGLGKSYIGGQMLVNLEEDRHRKALIVCPPKLQKMWEEIVDKFSLRAEVRSIYQLDKVLENERLMERKVVLVDESHHFRNKNTQRYEDLSDICYDKKVILLTATPYNIEAENILNQIKLFHPANITDLPIDPPNLRDFFKLVEKKERTLESLLQHILVRRTRNEIRHWYKDDMKRRDLKFPNRKGPHRIDYSIDEVYHSKDKEEKSIYQDIRNKLRSMNYTRYDLGSYVQDEFRENPKIKQLKQRGPQLVGLIRVILFKQFESSIAAFRSSITRILRVHKLFRQAIKQNQVPIGELEDLIDALESNDDLTFQELMGKEKGAYPIKWFEKQRLLNNLSEDIETLEHIYQIVEPIKPQEDDKLQELTKLLKSDKLNDKKVLVFTQYATTAHYLGENLKKSIPDKIVDFVSGVEGNVQKKVEKFAPKANLRKPNKVKDEIDILVATDVVGEGQNLQDGNVVINYDLHWNVVKMIQRIGRVDRVTTKHDNVYTYNFFPESKLDAHLNLEDRIKKRIKDIQQNIGEDNKYLSQDEQPNSNGFFEIYTENPETLKEREEKPQRFSNPALLQLIRKVENKNPKLFKKIKNLSSRVRTAKKTPKKFGKNGFIVFCRTKGYTNQYLLNKKGKVISRDRGKILRLLECKKSEKRLNLPEKMNARVTGVEKIFRKEVEERAAQLEASESNPIVRFVLRDLKSHARGQDKETKGRISRLRNLLVSGAPTRREKKKLRSLRRKVVTKDEYLDELEQILKRRKIHSPKSQDKQEKKPAIVEVVASEGLVNKNLI